MTEPYPRTAASNATSDSSGRALLAVNKRGMLDALRLMRRASSAFDIRSSARSSSGQLDVPLLPCANRCATSASLLSEVYPDELPYHPYWKAGQFHPAYLLLSTSLDQRRTERMGR